MLRVLKLELNIFHRTASLVGADEAVVLLLGGLEAEVADLDHSLGGDGTGAHGRLLLLDEGVVGLALAVGPRVEEAQVGGLVLERAQVADEGGVVQRGRGRPLAQRVVPVGVRQVLRLELAPLKRRGDDELMNRFISNFITKLGST